jgi:hypothetical protein
MVPPTIIFEVGETGVTAVGPVDHVVRLASGRGLVAAARVLARLVAQGHEAPQVYRYVVGLPDIERHGWSVQTLTQQVTAQERGYSAGSGDHLQDLAQDLLLQLSQRLGHHGGLPGPQGRTPGQPGRNIGGLRHAGPDAVVTDAQGDQILHRAGVNVARDHRDGHRVADHLAGRVAV